MGPQRAGDELPSAPLTMLATLARARNRGSWRTQTRSRAAAACARDCFPWARQPRAGTIDCNLLFASGICLAQSHSVIAGRTQPAKHPQRPAGCGAPGCCCCCCCCCCGRRAAGVTTAGRRKTAPCADSGDDRQAARRAWPGCRRLLANGPHVSFQALDALRPVRLPSARFFLSSCCRPLSATRRAVTAAALCIPYPALVPDTHPQNLNSPFLARLFLVCHLGHLGPFLT
jgi:hypothetical protein